MITRLLEAERTLVDVDAEARQRIKERVWKSIAVPGPGPGGDGAPPNGGGSDADLLGRLLHAKGLVASAFVVGLVTGGAAVGLMLGKQAPVAAVPAASATSASAPSAPELPLTVTNPPPPVPSATLPASAAATLPPQASAAGAASDSDLGAERALLSIARTAIGRRDGAAALTSLREHKRRFPRGRLSEERETLWIQALVLEGDTDAARTKAKTFHSKYPDSILGRGVEQSLADAGE